MVLRASCHWLEGGTKPSKVGTSCVVLRLLLLLCVRASLEEDSLKLVEGSLNSTTCVISKNVSDDDIDGDERIDADCG